MMERGRFFMPCQPPSGGYNRLLPFGIGKLPGDVPGVALRPCWNQENTQFGEGLAEKGTATPLPHGPGSPTPIDIQAAGNFFNISLKSHGSKRNGNALFFLGKLRPLWGRRARKRGGGVFTVPFPAPLDAGGAKRPATRMPDAAPRPTSGAGHNASRRAGDQRQRTAAHFPPKSEWPKPTTPPIRADGRSKPARKVAKWQDSPTAALLRFGRTETSSHRPSWTAPTESTQSGPGQPTGAV